MNNVKVLTLAASDFPLKLTAIPNSPKLLYYRGERCVELFKKPAVAIVGSRKVNQYGSHVTADLATGLASHGVVVVSGLALGVDSIAHRAALTTGGDTIAVLPCGIDTIYPRSHTSLGHEIAARGCIMSEYAGDYQPREYDFLKRNRIISALSDVVVVTQAALRSGSLNTARNALEQGRTVMAVPGPITDPLCAGNNELIKSGALVVTSVDDILRELSIQPDATKSKNYDLLATNKVERLIIGTLIDGIHDGERILARCKLGASEFNSTITMLELRGIVKGTGGNTWILA